MMDSSENNPPPSLFLFRTLHQSLLSFYLLYSLFTHTIASVYVCVEGWRRVMVLVDVWQGDDYLLGNGVQVRTS